jgi:uncharacterized membrane protein YphA (DoxX/SURF4 family)
MSFLPPAWLINVALFLLRLMVGIVFMSSGYAHLKNPNARSNEWRPGFSCNWLRWV